MLVMSDMSGPSMIKGFESYLTGYPLKDDGLYALAKTWYAAEMNRPGCVWTHTLLISTEDLSQISNLNQLATLFTRPNEANSFSNYKPQLYLDKYSHNNISSCESNEFSLNISTSVLVALYVSHERPVYIPARDSSNYEKLLLAIWSQQWPSLRASFSFCSGSISNRKLSGKSFDLQIVPSETTRQIKREVPEGIFIDEIKNMSIDSNYPSWVSILQSDLYCAQKSSIRKFFGHLDDKDVSERKDCADLVNIANAIEKMKESASHLSELTAFIAKAYPGRSSAVNLKRKVYGGDGTYNIDLPPIADEFQLLKELSTTEHYSAFDGECLNIRQRAGNLWHTDRCRAQELMSAILATEFTPLGEEVLTGISDKLNLSELIELYQSSSPGLFHVALSLNPTLATSPELWSDSNISKNRIIESLSKSGNITIGTIKDIIVTTLDSGINNVAEYLVSAFKKRAVESFLDWLDLKAEDSNNERCRYKLDFPDEWKYSIEKYPDIILEWLKKRQQLNTKTLIFITTILNPNSNETVRAGTNIWMPLLNNEEIDCDRDYLSVKVFLIALGFNNPDTGAANIVSYCFEEIHEALKRDNLGYKQWALIEKHVPTLSWLSNWDKCERIRRALIDKFINYKWPHQEFLNAIKSNETLQRSLEYCRRSNEGQRFLKNLVKELDSGTLYATEAQKKIVLYVANKG